MSFLVSVRCVLIFRQWQSLENISFMLRCELVISVCQASILASSSSVATQSKNACCLHAFVRLKSTFDHTRSAMAALFGPNWERNVAWRNAQKALRRQQWQESVKEAEEQGLQWWEAAPPPAAVKKSKERKLCRERQAAKRQTPTDTGCVCMNWHKSGLNLLKITRSFFLNCGTWRFGSKEKPWMNMSTKFVF